MTDCVLEEGSDSSAGLGGKHLQAILGLWLDSANKSLAHCFNNEDALGPVHLLKLGNDVIV